MDRSEAARPLNWKVALVEDHRLQRERTAEVLTHRAGMQVVVMVETLAQFVAWLETAAPSQRPHLLVLDLVVDRGDPADPRVVRGLTDAGMRVLVLSAMAHPPAVRDMIRAGATGFVGKQDLVQDIVTAAQTVAGGGRWETPELAAVLASVSDRPALSPKEEQALILYASGLTLRSVAERMGIKQDTAKQYLYRAKAKYADKGRSARTKVDLYRAAAEDGLLPNDYQRGSDL